METAPVETQNAPIIGHVQADAFCEGCGYNLHTQAVTRDERLGILICRCPECGRFAAAGNLTPTRQVWLNRLGLGLLIVWVLFLLGVFAVLTIFHGVVASGFVQEAVMFENVPPANPRNPGAVWRYHYVPRPSPRDAEQASRESFQMAVMVLLTVLLGAVPGGVVSVCMWHVRDWRRLVAFVPALVGVGIAFLVWTNEPSAREVQGIVQKRLGLCLLLESVGVLLGLLLGLWFARGALSILVPPKARQHLAFLWTIDGKQLKL